MVKVGVVLSGCGVFDGSEIHESVLTLLHLDSRGIEPLIMAPNITQMHVINHVIGEETKENRNVLIESARIARSRITDMAKVKAADISALIFPGGFGAAKNLSDFAVNGVEASINPEVKRLTGEMLSAEKPLGFICIMPAIAAKILHDAGYKDVKLTIGSEPETARKINALGCRHIECAVDEIAFDEKHKIVSTPAYMLGASISQVSKGIEKLVEKIVKLIRP